MENKYLLMTILPTIGGFLGGYLSSYLKKKGENLATKEDISKITKKVEEVKISFSKDLKIFDNKLGKIAKAEDKEIQIILKFIGQIQNFQKIISKFKYKGDFLIHAQTNEPDNTEYIGKLESEIKILRDNYRNNLVDLLSFYDACRIPYIGDMASKMSELTGKVDDFHKTNDYSNLTNECDSIKKTLYNKITSLEKNEEKN